MITMWEILNLAKDSLLAERAKLKRFKDKAGEAIGTYGQGAREKYEETVEAIENLDLKISEIDRLMGF